MRILVPVDGREMSLHIVDFLKARHALTGDSPEIEFFFAEPTLSAAFANRLQEKDLTAFYDERSQEVFDLVENRLGEAPFETSFKFRPGHPADSILQEALNIDADMIVMGTRGHSARTGFLFGSVSNAVVAKTVCPVLVIQGEVNVRKNPRIALAVDGSEWSERAIDYLIDNLSLFGEDPELRLIHVVPNISTSVMPATSCVALTAIGAPSEEAYVENVYERVVGPYMKKLDAAGVRYTRVPLMGLAAPAISRYASEEDIDLLVLGSHGYGNFKAAILGSVAMSVASAVEKPLLIVR